MTASNSRLDAGDGAHPNDPAARRVGLFGGSFDPVHRAHVALARSALTSLKLDEVRWLPAGQPWQKSRALAPADDRLAMLRLATAGEPRFVIDRREIDRAGASYTLDTVVELDAEQPGTAWFLMVGQDQHAALHTWQHWQQLLQRVTLAVAIRPGAARGVDDAVRQAGFEPIPLPPLSISATEIRQFAAAGRDLSALVPPEVARYIDLHRLYRASPGN